VLYPEILATIQSFSANAISEERKAVLLPLRAYIQEKRNARVSISVNFICTHNSRRSHLSQVWAQAMATYFTIPNVYCYSGGTEATAMFPKVAETLQKQGFMIETIGQGSNPVYAVKYSELAMSAICFSKKYDHPFNPKTAFAAILTCNSADEACPIVAGAEARFPIKFNDPKASDNTPEMDATYAARSLEIGQELWWVFGGVM
jgi:arsenate reductase (thioredoxin)